MRAQELREFTSDELRHRLQESRRELFNLRQQWNVGSLEDPSRMRAVRKDIARMLTILRERELAEEWMDKGATA
ncbi:MAG: 50S ribosomal protein L29 [Anaerolineales bacterium]